MGEIIVTTIIAAAAVLMFSRSIIRKVKGRSQCDCGSCSSRCPNYKK